MQYCSIYFSLKNHQSEEKMQKSLESSKVVTKHLQSTASEKTIFITHPKKFTIITTSVHCYTENHSASFLHLLTVCVIVVGWSFMMSWSPIQEVLPNVCKQDSWTQARTAIEWLAVNLHRWISSLTIWINRKSLQKYLHQLHFCKFSSSIRASLPIFLICTIRK